jgi:D-3-phosphoglycerate dehydrogenase / 2-oxoglutarate reductase
MTKPLVVRIGVYPHRVESTIAWERAALAEAGVDYRFVRPATVAEQIEAVRPADAVISSGGIWTEEVLGQMERCKVIVACGVGLDRVDLPAAARHGIMVCNMPDLCTDEVADHAFALLLACVRKVPRLHNRVVGGTWDRVLLEPMPVLRGKTLGLLGFGRIARAMGERARGFGLEVVAYDAYITPESAAAGGATLVDLETLARRSDIVSCHLPLTEETAGMLDEGFFRRMKPTAYFINTSRGGVVDEAALPRALREGWIAGAGLDVLAREPAPPDHPLLALENVIVTPHAAGFSDEVVDRIPRLAVAEALAVVRGGTPRPIAWANRAFFPSGAPSA